MNVNEAKATSRVLRWLIGDRDVSVEQAREDAAWLAGQSHKVLAEGITQERVAERWLRPTTTAVHESSALSPERLAQIKARCDAASDGPWEATFDDHGRGGSEVGIWSPNSVQNGEYIAELITSKRANADAAFIEHARQDIPALAEEVQKVHGTAVSQAQQIAHLRQVIAAAKLIAPGWTEGVTPMLMRCEHDVVLSTGTWLRPQVPTGEHPECLSRGLQDRGVSL